MYTEELVELYELEHEEFDSDLHLYRSYALMKGGPVLELGCGSGRLMVPLLRGGYSITGVDSSRAMLRAAQDKLAAVSRTGWSLVHSDISDLSTLPTEGFRLAYCALNTWAHVTDTATALRALTEVHRVMETAGILLLDLQDTEGRAPGRGELILGGVFSDGDLVVTKTVATVYDPASGLDHITLIWDRVRDGRMTRAVSQTEMRPYGRGEMEQLLARAGFTVDETMSTWELEPYDGRGDRLILVARKV